MTDEAGEGSGSIAAWLETLGLGEYAGIFEENRIGLDILDELSEGDLRDLGIPLGDRKRLLKEIGSQIGDSGDDDRHGSASKLAIQSTAKIVPPEHLAERILRSRASLEGERKQVTVLFADIRGSLELIEGSDPEDAHSILDPAIETMMDAVHRYEGTVNKIMGDGIMALFGAPIAHEDHAVRACYAALAIETGMAALNDEARARLGIDIQFRVGLHSGEVVVRAISNDLTLDYDAIGPTVHLAARMEQLATPGTTRLTGASLHLAEGFIKVEPLGPIPVKGVSEPIEVYRLTGATEAKSRLRAIGAGGYTRFVGRDTEMDALRAGLERAAAGQGQVVAVVGEPGVGKSRLYYEFIRGHHVKDCLIIESGSVSHGKAAAFLPLVDLLRTYFGISLQDGPRTIRERIVGKLLTLDESLRAIEPALLSLFDIQIEDEAWTALDSSARRQRVLDACRALMIREAEVQPLILVFEDLHWIDDKTQSFLDELVAGIGGVRILLLVNYRPEYVDSWTTRTYYTRLRIDPLEAASAAELLTDLVGGGDELATLLIERTEGNPFFIEESVRAPVDDGALEGERGDYRLTVAIDKVVMPATVQSVLAARIDRLEPEEKRLLQIAAVIGKDFPLPLLESVAEGEASQIQQCLARLHDAELVYETRLFPDPEYTFKHALTHDVAYGGLLSERKRALHARIVEAMERFYEGRESEQLERLAHHAVQGELWEKAHRYARDSGNKALRLDADRNAAEAFENALAALAHLPETRDRIAEAIDINFQIRDTLFVVGDVDRIEERLEEAEKLAAKIDDSERLATTL